ncbi:divalent-cation tolerance protein CutA [Nocardiopsis lambiniae]|uniref:Divalent-cation tolerance protein CutA n=1 Tax=Nocardiopsis lambiniae TaxID=3075539 RepID=A0ABU2M2D3_9ACTN|nr:divalent-cation tolerance protein CutA [Nocardiopsis sp. DSM 44743]MDT0326805.1 divalent-cation tolerance protein CutA [Nocardiopsis sp. DSM 44743]
MPHTSTPGIVRVEVTVDTRDGADRLAESVVGHRLAACAQVGGPITSHYRWEGEVRRDEEWTVVLKTAEDRLDDLTARIVREHPYDVPEVVAVPVVGGNPSYLAWVRDETRPAEAPGAVGEGRGAAE